MQAPALRAIWSGSISFGLVSVSVRLYAATRHRDVRFREVDRLTGRPLRHQRVRETLPPPSGAAPPALHGAPPLPPRPGETASGNRAESRGATSRVPAAAASPREVGREEVVKGFEVAPERFVTVTADELEALAPERTRTIDVEQFVAAAAVDPIYFETAYYAVPARDQVRPFAVLLEAMRETATLGICWVTLRRKRHLAALRPRGGLMLLTTMFYADEILPADGVTPPVPRDLTSREREMAALLIKTLSGPFEPGRYRDEYRQRLVELLDERARHLPLPLPIEPEHQVRRQPAPVQVEELMASLQASVEEARRRRTQGRRATRRGA